MEPYTTRVLQAAIAAFTLAHTTFYSPAWIPEMIKEKVLNVDTCPNCGQPYGYEKECLSCGPRLSQPTTDREPSPELEPDDWDW